MNKKEGAFFAGPRRFAVIFAAVLLVFISLIWMHYKIREAEESRVYPAAQINETYAYEQAQKLGKGINMGNVLDAANEGDWGITFKEDYFKIIKEAGFDTIRVPINWSAHALGKKPYTVNETFFKRIDWVVENGKKYGLNLVLSFNNYKEMYADPDKHKERFMKIWEQIAWRYRYSGSTLYYELINEPHDALSGDTWNKILKDTIRAVRKNDTYHTLIVSGDCWGNAHGLNSLKVPASELNVVCTFHSYTPMIFTHQSVEFAEKEYAYIKNIVWPGPPSKKAVLPNELKDVDWIKQWFDGYNSLPYAENPSGPKPILEELDFADNWARKNNRPIWFGEFGVTKNADMASRANWTKFMTTECEKRNISWAYWDFCAGCAAYDLKNHRWYEDILKALIY